MRPLAHRVALMRYLEQRPRRYALLFVQLAQTPRVGEVLPLSLPTRIALWPSYVCVP